MSASQCSVKQGSRKATQSPSIQLGNGFQSSPSQIWESDWISEWKIRSKITKYQELQWTDFEVEIQTNNYCYPIEDLKLRVVKTINMK